MRAEMVRGKLPSDAPLVTIGITCFDAALTIRRAVLSAVVQDWPNTEIIVVDDCSTDDSWQILETLAGQYPMKLIKNEQNKGVATARNTLLEAAQGEFIAYFDDDDESYPQRLTKQWRRIVDYESRHNAEFVLCTAVRNVAIGDKIDHRSTALGQVAPEPHGTMVADYFLGLYQPKTVSWGLFGTCVLMARVSALRELGGFDPQFRRRAEWDMAISGAFRGAHFIAVDEPLIVQHKTQGRDKSGDVPLRYALMLRKKYKNYLSYRKMYLASCALALANFHRRKGRFLSSLVYTFLAYISSTVFIWRRLTGKRGG
jgi:glycosyltransferase involved in cell wall biosynthesis